MLLAPDLHQYATDRRLLPLHVQNLHVQGYSFRILTAVSPTNAYLLAARSYIWGGMYAERERESERERDHSSHFGSSHFGSSAAPFAWGTVAPLCIGGGDAGLAQGVFPLGRASVVCPSSA